MQNYVGQQNSRYHTDHAHESYHLGLFRKAGLLQLTSKSGANDKNCYQCVES